MPDQISEAVDSYWSKYAKTDTADKETAKQICEESVNYLGTFVGGKTFDESSFDTKFSVANAMGGGVSKETLTVFVTSMVTL